MFRKLLMVLIAGVFLLSACAAPGAQQLPDSGEGQVTEDPDAPVSSGDPQDPSLPAWAPRPEDEDLARGEVEIDTAELLTLESFPPQFMLHLTGLIQNPCAGLRVVVNDPDANNEIHVDVYSVYDLAVMCAQAQESFDVNIPLGSLPEGEYRVLVNGEPVADVVSPQGSVDHLQATDELEIEVDDLIDEGEVNMIERPVQVQSTELVIRESMPPQYALHVVGTLPTPCHQLQTEVSGPDANNRIEVRVYALVDPEIMCAQVIEPFETMVELGSLNPGRYQVLLNGEAAATIDG